MPWQIDTVIDAKDDLAAKLKAAIEPQFKAARATQVAMNAGRKPRPGESDAQAIARQKAEREAFWKQEDEQVARAVKGAIAVREGHAGARLKVTITGHCRADGSGSVGVTIVTLR